MARRNLLSRLRTPGEPARDIATINDFAAAVAKFVYNGHLYQTTGLNTTLGQHHEEIPNNFVGFAHLANSSPVLFACIATRMLLFSEARFQFRRFEQGRPGDLFGDDTLGLLERPWPNGTTGELLARMEQDVSLAGNFYATRVGDELRRLRPDWVTILRGARSDTSPDDELNTELIGYAYTPGGFGSTNDPTILSPRDVVHYSPYPDPEARFRGMSWVSPVLRELSAHQSATSHKLAFFEHGATPNLVVKLDKSVAPDEFDRFVEKIDEGYKGALNAYKTLYLGGGADADVVGSSFEQMSFTSVQGASETLVAAASGVAPVIVGFSEGLQAATYSNYGQARRRVADGTLRPLWRIASASLETAVPPPSSAQLWYDDRDIAFLREDKKDEAEIQQTEASTIRTLIDAGFAPDAIIDAVNATDLSKLAGTHTGLSSVQLQPPATNGDVPVEDSPEGS